ncbi:MAG: hypothetical protein KGJ51_10245, partial [Acidobacteriota bacterium]|nr:hypothetical protein [Acidobacteriota bacterium]
MCCAVLALSALTARAGAAELATLSNGFTMNCDHHALVNGQVRLYLSSGEDNYIALEPKQIAAFTPLAEAPAPAPPHPVSTRAD